MGTPKRDPPTEGTKVELSTVFPSPYEKLPPRATARMRSLRAPRPPRQPRPPRAVAERTNVGFATPVAGH